MPPKREKPSKQKLHELLREHRVRLEGPAPPKDWPGNYRHHFQAIRDIESTRYDDYKLDRSIPRSRGKDYRGRAYFLRTRAYDLLDNIQTNESTWRDLEVQILHRFDQRVIWWVYSNHTIIVIMTFIEVSDAAGTYGNLKSRPRLLCARLRSLKCDYREPYADFPTYTCRLLRKICR